jgi:hypothetical protein
MVVSRPPDVWLVLKDATGMELLPEDLNSR